MPVYKPEAVAEGGDVGSDGTRREYEKIPGGTWVDATVVKVAEETKPFKDDDGNEITKVAFTFEFQYGGQDRKAWGETSTKFVFHPNCKLRNWSQEILATDLPEEFVLNTDHLVGEKCQVLIGYREWEAGSKNGRSWAAGWKNFAEDVKRSGSNIVPDGAKAAPAPPAEAYDDPF